MYYIACCYVDIQIVFQGMSDDLLPTRVGGVVDMAYCPPLLLQLCNEGTVCIQMCTCNPTSSLCANMSVLYS